MAVTLDQMEAYMAALGRRSALARLALGLLVDLCFEDTIRGLDGSPYLTRYMLLGLGKKIGRVRIHCFHRGDTDREHHNHPLWALSLILRGGYREERLMRDGTVRVRDYGPGSLNLIMPRTFHRVDLIDGEAWTLIVSGPVHEEGWGFIDPETSAYIPHEDFRTWRARKGLA
jgi:hypothetical protein